MLQRCGEERSDLVVEIAVGVMELLLVGVLAPSSTFPSLPPADAAPFPLTPPHLAPHTPPLSPPRPHTTQLLQIDQISAEYKTFNTDKPNQTKPGLMDT